MQEFSKKSDVLILLIKNEINFNAIEVNGKIRTGIMQNCFKQDSWRHLLFTWQTFLQEFERNFIAT